MYVRREIVSWQDSSDITSVIDHACDHTTGPILVTSLIISLILNSMFCFVFWKIPMVRGVSWHVICTIARNVASFVLRDRGFDTVRNNRSREDTYVEAAGRSSRPQVMPLVEIAEVNSEDRDLIGLECSSVDSQHTVETDSVVRQTLVDTTILPLVVELG